MSKQEDELSEAMTHAAKVAKETNLSKFKQMKLIARAYSTHREVSIQEAAYHILPELYLRKTFPKVEFANTNKPEERVRMCLPRKELKKQDEESTEIFQQSSLDLYMLRPVAVRTLCYAEFLSNYEISRRPDDNDSQPVELTDEVIEINHADNSTMLPRTLTLLNRKIMRRRKVQKVIRYHIPNAVKFPEKYAYHLLILYYPFQNEPELAIDGSHCAKLQSCLDIVNRNKSIFVVEALLNYRNVLAIDPILDYENDETSDQLTHDVQDNYDEEMIDTENNEERQYSCAVTPSTLPDHEINASIRTLNEEQREAFETVHEWAKRLMKNLNSVIKKIFFSEYLV